MVEFKGRPTLNGIKPDGTPRKLIDVSRLSNMGWNYSIDLEDGLDIAYKWYLKNYYKNSKHNLP